MQTKAKVNFKFTKFVILLFYEGFQIFLAPPTTPVILRNIEPVKWNSPSLHRLASDSSIL